MPNVTETIVIAALAKRFLMLSRLILNASEMGKEISPISHRLTRSTGCSLDKHFTSKRR